MKFLATIVALTVALAFTGGSSTDAPTGFDNKSNGMVDDVTHQADQSKFDDVKTVADGLGPLYNAQSCRECHQNPTSGGTSQVSELRVGHEGKDRLFQNPEIPIAHGAEVISGRTWRASCGDSNAMSSRSFTNFASCRDSSPPHSSYLSHFVISRGQNRP